MEVLIALSVLVTGLTLIAAGLSRQVSALRVIETTQASLHLADRLLVREILLQRQDVEGPLPELEGFRTSVSRGPDPKLEIEQVTGEVSWELRGRPRSVRMETGLAKKPGAAP